MRQAQACNRRARSSLSDSMAAQVVAAPTSSMSCQSHLDPVEVPFRLHPLQPLEQMLHPGPIEMARQQHELLAQAGLIEWPFRRPAEVGDAAGQLAAVLESDRQCACEIARG